METFENIGRRRLLLFGVLGLLALATLGLISVSAAAPPVARTERPVIAPEAALQQDPGIDVTKTVSETVNNGNGTYDITFEIVVENTGNVDLEGLQVEDDLSAAFPGAVAFKVLNVESDDFAVNWDPPNPGYNGTTDTNLLKGTDTLDVGGSGTILLTVQVTPGTLLGRYCNIATASGTSPAQQEASDESDEACTTLDEDPSISVTKTVSETVNNGNGTYDITFEIVVENTGDVDLEDLQVEDDLSAAFPGAVAFKVLNVESDDFAVNWDPPNPGYNGTTDTNLLKGTDTLDVGGSGTILLTVQVTPGTLLGRYCNIATASGTSPAQQEASDESDEACTTLDEDPSISVTKTVSETVNNGNGTYDITFEIVVENTGDVDLEDLQVEDDLSAAFPGAVAFKVLNVESDDFAVNWDPPNPGYNGTTDTNLLKGTDTLDVGGSGTILLTVQVTPGTLLGRYCNIATASGTSPAQQEASDESDEACTTLDEDPSISVTKTVSETVNNGNGTYDITFEIVVENTGDVDLEDLQVEDDLSAAFPGAVAFKVLNVESDDFAVNWDPPNPGYNGTTDTNLLKGTDTLDVGGSGTILLTVQVTPGTLLGRYCNIATASGTSPAQQEASDESDEACTTLDEDPSIYVEKQILSVQANPDGSFTVVYTILVKNDGDVELRNVQVEDDLSATFAGAGFTVDLVVTVGLTKNNSYNGTTDINLLDGSDTLAVGQSGTITIVVTITPGTSFGPYCNTATASGTSPGEKTVKDDDEKCLEIADLSVVKTDSTDPVFPGDLMFYTLTVHNAGPSDAVDVVVTDTLPSEVTFLNSNPDRDEGPNPLIWNLGTLAAGASVEIVILVQVDSTVPGVFTNIVQVESPTPDPNPDNNEDTEDTTLLVPGIKVTKTATPSTAVPGMPITFTVTITNIGQLTLNPVKLVDTLPPNFTYVVGSGDPSDPNIIAGTLLIWLNLGTLLPGESLQVTFQAVAAKGVQGTFTNTAQAFGTYAEGKEVTDIDQEPVQIVTPSLSVNKIATGVDRDKEWPNYVTFTIEIENLGPTVLDVVPLEDIYDAEYLSFRWANPMPNEPADDGRLNWWDLTGPPPHGFNTNLAVGAKFVVTLVFRVEKDIVSTDNVAVVDGARDIYDNPAPRDEDRETIVNVPTLIELLSFSATAAGDHCLVEWETAWEVDNWGFNLYRSVTASVEDAVWVHSQVALGSAFEGHRYLFEDRSTLPGHVYYYWLEDVDTAGKATLHGPVSASLPYRVYLPMTHR
jgi:uncharacterized repeat protein (TIGR01451 family)